MPVKSKICCTHAHTAARAWRKHLPSTPHQTQNVMHWWHAVGVKHSMECITQHTPSLYGVAASVVTDRQARKQCGVAPRNGGEKPLLKNRANLASLCRKTHTGIDRYRAPPTHRKKRFPRSQQAPHTHTHTRTQGRQTDCAPFYSRTSDKQMHQHHTHAAASVCSGNIHTHLRSCVKNRR